MANQPPSSPLHQLLDDGSSAFADNWSRWVNQWSQYELLKLAEAYLGGRLFHSSQIGGFASRKLRDPAPKVFLAVGAFNVALARSLDWPKIDTTPDFGLPRKLPESRRALWDLREPLIDASGVAMGPEGLFSVFTGLRALPELMAPRQIPSELEQAATEALGRYLRMRLPALGIDWLRDMPQLQAQVPCIRDLLYCETVSGPRVVKALPVLAEIADTTEEALWALIEATLPS